MLDLTFGEQVKIILSRKGMTIKELAEQIEKSTGKKMSRQNLTQRLGRDNFQEQDMRMIAGILGCSFHLTILEDDTPTEKKEKAPSGHRAQKVAEKPEPEILEAKTEVHETAPERDITVGELVDMYEGGYEEISQDIEEEAVTPIQEENGYAAENENDRYDIENGQPLSTVGNDAEESYAEEAYEEDIPQEEEMQEEAPQATVEEVLEEIAAIEAENQKPESKPEEKKPHGWRSYFMRRKKPEETVVEKSEEQTEDVVLQKTAAQQSEEPEYAEVTETEMTGAEAEAIPEAMEEEVQEELPVYEEDPNVGERNPYTGKEYESNSVRMHPTRIGYVQVYDRENHQWTDMTEWAFLGYQERKKALLGKDYEPPIYLD
ncbi:MAG: hypothetical protein ACI4V6_01500 [Dorea sp.]